MRLFTLIVLFGLPAIVTGQKKYNCEYAGRVSFAYPDSFKQVLRNQVEEKGLGAQLTEQILEQLTGQLISSAFRGTVSAGFDSTFILNKKSETDERNITMNMRPQLLLFHKGELYQFDSSSSGFSPQVNAEPPKAFVSTGATKVIIGYSCSGYISTDSSCTIWATSDLPSYINPGIRAGNIKGAILAFRLMIKETTIESEMDKIELKASQVK